MLKVTSLTSVSISERNLRKLITRSSRVEKNIYYVLKWVLYEMVKGTMGGTADKPAVKSFSAHNKDKENLQSLD